MSKDPVRVTQVCIGRFHHVDLARQLYKHGALARFFTGYPSWKLRGGELPKDLVTTFPWLVTPYMALGRWRMLPAGLGRELTWAAHETLDAYAAKNLPECNVLIALSGSGLRAAKVAKQRGINFVCDRGSSHIRYQDRLLKEEFARWRVPWMGVDPRVMEKEEAEYEAATVITVPSEFAFRSFLEMGVPVNKLRKVPFGVDRTVFAKVAEPEADVFQVLFVGQVSFRKGIPYLLDAFARFRHPRKYLKIVGSLRAEMKPYLERRPLGSEVEFMGPVPHGQLKDVMSRSHVMVLPSVEEGLALVQAEALACGCPVISTWNTGAADLLTDGVEGFIVPPRDSEAIAERFQLLADDPERRCQMSEAALRRITTLGGWDAYGEQMMAVLHDLLEPAPNRERIGEKNR
jgi:starch synthase